MELPDFMKPENIDTSCDPEKDEMMIAIRRYEKEIGGMLITEPSTYTIEEWVDMQRKDCSESPIDVWDDEKRKKADQIYNEANEITAASLIVFFVGVLYLLINKVVAILLFAFSVLLFVVHCKKDDKQVMSSNSF